MEVMLEEQNAIEDQEYLPKTVKGVVERSYLQHRQDEEDNIPFGETQIADVSVAVSRDQDSNVIIDLVSVDPDAIETVESALYKQHTLRRNVIELPMVELERIARVESVDILSYLQKMEKSRLDEKERLLNSEHQLDEYEQQPVDEY